MELTRIKLFRQINLFFIGGKLPDKISTNDGGKFETPAERFNACVASTG